MPSAATGMDLDIVILSEVRQTKRNMMLCYKTETDSHT